jgi:hypothetical protein
MMRAHHNSSEEGASLVIVLIVISLFGLVIGGLLTEAGASVKYTKTVSDHEKKVYAADAAVSLGIQQLQQHGTLCPINLSNEVVQVVTVNGVATQVSCNVTSGSTVGGLGYAIITLSPDNDSLSIQSGSDPKKVTGSVHVTGDVAGWNKGLDIDGGDFSQTKGNGCISTTDGTIPSSLAGSLTLDTGYPYTCETSSPTVPSYTAPAVPGLAQAPRAPSGSLSSCKFYYPGRYDSDPALDVSRVNYFATGVYYFTTGFTITATGTDTMRVFGGQPASYETVRYASTMPSCATDSNAKSAAPDGAPEVNGPSTGVKFIFGSSAGMTSGDKSSTELFARTLNGNADTSEPTLMSVPQNWQAAGWAYAVADHSLVLNFASGSDKNLLVHGLVYAPSRAVSLYATTDVDAAVLGGVIAWKVDLQSSNGGGGSKLTISASDGTPAPRHIVVKAAAPHPAPASGERQVVSTAVIQVANDSARTVTIESWRTRGPSDPS